MYFNHLFQQMRQSSAPVQGRNTPGPTPHSRTHSAGAGSFSRQAGNPVITREGHGPMGVTSHKIVSTCDPRCILHLLALIVIYADDQRVHVCFATPQICYRWRYLYLICLLLPHKNICIKFILMCIKTLCKGWVLNFTFTFASD